MSEISGPSDIQKSWEEISSTTGQDIIKTDEFGQKYVDAADVAKLKSEYPELSDSIDQALQSAILSETESAKTVSLGVTSEDFEATAKSVLNELLTCAQEYLDAKDALTPEDNEAGKDDELKNNYLAECEKIIGIGEGEDVSSTLSDAPTTKEALEGLYSNSRTIKNTIEQVMEDNNNFKDDNTLGTKLTEIGIMENQKTQIFLDIQSDDADHWKKMKEIREEAEQE